MPRTPTGRTSTTSRRRVAGASSIPSIRIAPRRPTTLPPYVRDARWATPTAPRNDVFVVDIADRHTSTASLDDDPLLLTA